MKLTKLSVLFSSLYFGLVGNVSAETLTFRDKVDPICGFKTPMVQAGTILFNDEGTEDETFATFTPYSNDPSNSKVTLSASTLSGTVTFVDNSAVAPANIKLWVGTNRNDAAFDTARDFSSPMNVTHGVPLSAIATVNHSQGEIKHSSTDFILTTNISLTCGK